MLADQVWRVGLGVVLAGLALLTAPAAAAPPERDIEPGAGPAAMDNTYSIETLAREYEAIAKTIDLYIDGGRQGSSEIMKQAFLPEAGIFGLVDGQLVGGSVQTLYDQVDSRPPVGAINYKIVRLEAMAGVAMVRVDIDDWAGLKYCDMFTLIKDGSGWKIAGKVSSQY